MVNEDNTIILNKELANRLKELARHNEISVEELIKRLVDIAIQRTSLSGRA